MDDLLAEVDAILADSAARDPTTQIVESKLIRLWWLRKLRRYWLDFDFAEAHELRQLERELFGCCGLLRAKHE